MPDIFLGAEYNFYLGRAGVIFHKDIQFHHAPKIDSSKLPDMENSVEKNVCVCLYGSSLRHFFQFQDSFLSCLNIKVAAAACLFVAVASCFLAAAAAMAVTSNQRGCTSQDLPLFFVLNVWHCSRLCLNTRLLS